MSKTALITGASAGLGAEFAQQLAQQGYNLVLVARRLEKLNALAERLQGEHPNLTVTCIAADLSDKAAPQLIFDKAQSLAIDIDFLINNAGAAGPDLLTDTPWQIHADYLQLMMLSVTELCHLFVPGMAERGFGRVINVSSVAGRIARGGDCHYGPSKNYLVALSEGLGLTVKAKGVHVSALCPGFTHTDFHDVADMAEMKASTPKFIWYSAETVVSEGLRAVERGKLVCISGRLYRWLDPFLQSKLTRWLVLSAAS
ncbi:MAG: SDR family NAD(P)-dependent oxidoreductase [bacterium]